MLGAGRRARLAPTFLPFAMSPCAGRDADDAALAQRRAMADCLEAFVNSRGGARAAWARSCVHDMTCVC